jgi:hypothetical protein
MALYNVTVKNGGICNGIRIEKGMSVEVVDTSDPLSYTSGKEAVIKAFDRKYGVDIKKAGRLGHAYLEVKKIN